jgi:hypothetical protein
MKWFAIALLLPAAACAADMQQLKQIQSVYILPMASGMDQYLANKIARQGLFQVLTDPQKADAILADRIGEPFERKLQELYPPPPAKKSAKDKDADDHNTEKDEPAVKSEKSDKDKAGLDTGPPIDHPSSFGRGRGTIFLVDRKSRAVIWSTYDRPNNMHADTLDKTADDIVHRLKRDLTAKESK